MKTISINLYNIEELEPKAKEKALNDLRASDTWCMSERISDDFDFLLQEKGLTDIKASWSLGYCQGDGVAFDGSVNAETLVSLGIISQDDIQKLGLSSVSVKLIGHDTHQNSMEFELECDNDAPSSLVASTIESVSFYFKRLSQEFEKLGYSIVEYTSSEEFLVEECQANEWTFEASGKMRNI